MKEGYDKHGMRCFFRVLSASYLGVFGTVIYLITTRPGKTGLMSSGG